MSDLEALACKFKEWRGHRRYQPYPQHLWEEISRLVKIHPLSTVADALGINPAYLRYKFNKKPQKQISFVPVEINSFPLPISIEINDKNHKPLIVRFQADHQQLINIISSLLESSS